MPRSGLSREKVVEAAAELIERRGYAEFSMRALADSLDIKTASLYNHVESMEKLTVEVCAYALRMQYAAQMSAIEGKSGTEAIFALADAYRDFAKRNRELYRLIIGTAAACGDQLEDASRCIVEPFMKALEHTALDYEEKCHWQRVLRGIVHGFVSQEDAGFFSHLPADVEHSFQTAIGCFADGLTQAEKRKRQ